MDIGRDYLDLPQRVSSPGGRDVHFNLHTKCTLFLRRARSCLLELTWKMEMTVSRLECHMWGEVTAHDFKGQGLQQGCLLDC